MPPQTTKVLLYCPLNPQTPRVYARTLQSIFTLDWPYPLEIVFGKHDHEGKANSKGKYDDMVRKHNWARELAIAGDYRALFFVEADMILPPDALKRLAAIDTDVAYGLYASRHATNQWLAFDQLSKNTGKSIDRRRQYCVDNWGKVIETKGVGMGCTLIQNRVFTKIGFEIRGPCADDWYFSLDCIERGFRQHHDLGVVCGHIDGDHVLWPSLQGEEMVQIETL